MLRVYVESDDASKLLPVLVVVRHERGVVSWELPMRILDQDTKERATFLQTVDQLKPMGQTQSAGNQRRCSSFTWPPDTCSRSSPVRMPARRRSRSVIAGVHKCAINCGGTCI